MINIWQIIVFIVVVLVFVVFYLKNRKTEHEFISIVNHTFRTPLTRINWISKELERSDISQNEKLLYIQNIKNATDKLLEIVDLIVGIKDIKNNNGYFLTATSIRSVVEESMEKYREGIRNKNILFEVSSFSDIPLLTLDLKKIKFSIDTLIENAIMYTPKDGKISIDCTLKSNSKLLFYVSDTGMGLNLIDKVNIFSRFYRSRNAELIYPDGMGLRLYISKKIINRHNGKIYAKSKGINKGSIFFIELPLNK